MEDVLGKPFDGCAKTASEAIKQCVLANRILANEGVFDCFGHVSLRNPENPNTFFLSKSCSPEFVREADIMELDLDGNVVAETDMRPYAERFIHSEILRHRPDVNSVCHAHSFEVVVLSATDVPIVPVTHLGGIFYEGVTVYEDYDVSCGTLIMTIPEAQRVARCLGHRRGCLMKNHGAVVVGESTAHMVMSMIALRDNCKVQLSASLLGGKVKSLSSEMGRASAEKNFTANPLGRAWNYWVDRAKKVMPDIAHL